MNEYLALIHELKKINAKQINNMHLADVMIGTVQAVDPLEVRVSDKLVLDDGCLILSTNVVDHNVMISVDHKTETKESLQGGDPDFREHLHEYKGKKRFYVHNGLKVGEKVVLLRLMGGQQYYILDRARYGNDVDSD